MSTSRRPQGRRQRRGPRLRQQAPPDQDLLEDQRGLPNQQGHQARRDREGQEGREDRRDQQDQRGRADYRPSIRLALPLVSLYMR